MYLHVCDVCVGICIYVYYRMVYHAVACVLTLCTKELAPGCPDVVRSGFSALLAAASSDVHKVPMRCLTLPRSYVLLSMQKRRRCRGFLG